MRREGGQGHCGNTGLYVLNLLRKCPRWVAKGTGQDRTGVNLNRLLAITLEIIMIEL